ncbi:ferric/cupric-chelate reductase [Rhizophlyctis rosea]|uniref:Ferric/cupric-chelate reductase n=1 Tax=Rhizophlyctis rosea TaxID=64517 RepID=A0AAD5X958_9FUNG|nr:ferric/cupric-chelate reductase [Rhizophlyctis rosea]
MSSRIPAVKTALVAAVILFPMTLIASLMLQTVEPCFAMACPEEGPDRNPLQVGLYVYYAWLLVLAVLVHVVHKNRWSYRRFLGLSWTSWVVLFMVLGQQAFQFGHWFTYLMKGVKVLKWTDYLRPLYRVLGFNIAIQLSLTLFPQSRDGFLSSALGIDYDGSIRFHRWSGFATVDLALAHTLVYLVRNGIAGGKYGKGAAGIRESLFHPGKGLLTYWDWTSLVGLFSLIAFVWVMVSAFEYFRRNQYNFFWFSHMLSFAAILLAFMHASPMFYFSFPAIVLYIIDALVRVFNRRKEYVVKSITMEPSGYLRLDIAGTKFKFVPGQWILINIPSLSRVMWHPFSIASSPYGGINPPKRLVQQITDGILEHGDTLDRSQTLGRNDTFRSDYSSFKYPDHGAHTLNRSNTMNTTMTYNTMGSMNTMKREMKEHEKVERVHTLKRTAKKTKRDLTLIIKPQGAKSWTGSLLKAWNKKQDLERPKNLKVYIDGPHGHVPPNFMKSDHLVAIVGGSGIPGALSMAMCALDQDIGQSVDLLWTARESNAPTLSAFQELQSHPNAPGMLTTTTVITGGPHPASRIPPVDFLASLEHKFKPNGTISVYVCGPQSLNNDVQAAALALGKKRGVEVRLRIEGYHR